MKRLFNILFILLSVQFAAAQTGDYNPTNPGDPNAYYKLAVEASPSVAGDVSLNGNGQLAFGGTTYCYANPKQGYVFKKWMMGDEVVSESSSFRFTMPAENVVLIAYFEPDPDFTLPEYNPSNPGDPNADGYTRRVKLYSVPSAGGYFNNNNFTMLEGNSTNLYAYPNSNYRFVSWKKNGVVVSTSNPLTVTMGGEDLEYTATFVYDPQNPGNPNSNYFNSSTGELIVDDFVTGSLSNAIYNATNGEYAAVQSVSVVGKMESSDFGFSYNMDNCTLIDLARTTGYTEVPSWAFEYSSSLSRIVLPASVEHIGYCSFYYCESLSELVCYADYPPTVGNNAFYGVPEGLVVRVPSSSMSLYIEADGWKDFTILPLDDETCSINVSLPVEAADGRYRNMTLEMNNISSGQVRKFIVTDRLSYTFSNVIRDTKYNIYLKNAAGDILGSILDVKVESDDVNVAFASLKQLKDVELKVLAPDGSDVTQQVQITWQTVDGNFIKMGNKASSLVEDSKVVYRIALPQALAMQYLIPENTVYQIGGGNNNLTVTLAPIPQMVISGVVKDVATGSPISNAVVAISQTLNGRYSKAYTVKSDRNGAFSQTIFKAPANVNVSYTEYVSQNFEVTELADELSLGTVSLKSITGARLSLAFTYRESVKAGEEPVVKNYYSDHANISYSIQNLTAGRMIQQYSVQYPEIVLLEEVAEGDQLNIVAKSRTGKFNEVESGTEIGADNRGSLSFEITQLGGFTASYATTENNAVVAILYNSKGELLKRYDYSANSVSVTEMQDGRYTLVSMGSSNLFNSVYQLSQLAASGLVEGVDYIKNDFRVGSGAITVVENNNIPLLDESKLYYTGENTKFAVNKSSVVAGNYLTLSGKVDFKSAFASNVSDVKMVVDMPESVSFVDNSVMVGRSLAAYEFDGRRLTVPLGEDYSGEVRFCIIPTESGEHAPNAFVNFNIEGKEVLQPIGSARFTVKDLTIVVPQVTAKTAINVSGTAIGNSNVKIYDNNVFVGETKALANGVWSAVCELDEPYNLSKHSIYAKVTTAKGLELQTEVKECFYDKNAVQPNTVTMTFYNGWLRQNIEVVFDYNNPQKMESSYMFYTTTDFTFVVDFTNNSPDVVSDVTIYVFTDNGNIIPLTAKYNSRTDKWVAVKEFSWGNLPTNVSVDFFAKSDLELDDLYVDRAKDEIEEIIDEVDDAVKEELELIEELEAEIAKSEPDETRIINLINVIRSKRDYDIELTPEQTEYVKNVGGYDEVPPYSYFVELEVFNKYAESVKDIGKPLTTPITIESQIVDGKKTPKVEIIPAASNEKCMLDNSWNIPEDYDFSDNTITITNDNGDKVKVDFNGVMELPKNKEEAIDFQEYLDEILGSVGNFWDPYSKIVDGLELGLKGALAMNNAMIAELGKTGYLNNLDQVSSAFRQRASIIGYLDDFDKAGKILGPLGVAIDGFNTLNSGWDTWNDYEDWNKLKDAIAAACSKEAADGLNSQLEDYRDWLLRRNLWRTALNGLSTGLSVVGAVSAPATLGGSVAMFAAGVGLGAYTDNYAKGYEQQNEENWRDMYDKIKDNPNCKPIRPDKDIPIPPFDPIPPIHDPSGYVYEAVSSNRLQGVTATCYYKETVEDMYGDLYDRVVMWDAENYAQENPLFTDANGMYRWDVPQGLWQVKLEKEGYETAYSEWLPVPPPQLDVNIAMVQNKAPEVAEAHAYAEGVVINFDKYMDISTLTPENIIVYDGTARIDGEVRLLDEEVAYDDEAVRYASKVRFVPYVPFASKNVTVMVNRAVKSYAGIPMQETFTQLFGVEYELEEIVAEPVISVPAGGEYVLRVEMRPAAAVAGKKLGVMLSSEVIAAIDAGTVLVDNNGMATVRVTGNIAGTAVLTFKMEGSDVTASTKVEVTMDELLETVAAPVASVATGYVAAGTAVTLSSATEGAVIYYTLDGSCPCDDSGEIFVYDGTPVIINETVTLKAIARADNMYDSDIVTYVYTIPAKSLYTVIFMVDGEAYKNYELQEGEALQSPDAPVKEGYTFVGWDNLLDVMPGRNLVVTAKYTLNSYKVTFVVDGRVFYTTTVKYGTSVDLPDGIPVKDGYTFAGWNNLPDVMPAKDVVIVAGFKVNSYTVTFMVDGEAYKAVTLAYGAKVSAPAAPTKEGHKFAGWDNMPSTMPAGNVEVNALFTVNSYTVTFKVNGKLYHKATVDYGNEIELPEEPVKEGYSFAGWEGLPDVMPANNVTVNAAFEINSYTVTFMIGEEVYAVIYVEYGGKIELPEEPLMDGCTFDGWVGIPATMPAENIVVTGSFTQVETGIATVEEQGTAVIYDLSGRRVTHPTKGIYIINGKKVVY